MVNSPSFSESFQVIGPMVGRVGPFSEDLRGRLAGEDGIQVIELDFPRGLRGFLRSELLEFF